MEQHYRRLKCHLKWKFNVRKENMKLLSLFSEIGAFEKALDKLNIKYELVNYCEIDKYAAKSYALIHNESESKNLGDITKVDTSKLPNDIDLVTYGFPCQDISLAGKQKGMFNEDGTKTRSGLFFEALRIIEDTKPRVAIAENVKNLVSKKFNAQFQIVLESLEQAGYNNYYQILNAKDYGIPQNRERVFIVSIRKDIDDGTFEFPKPVELKLRLKDVLEDEVNEKYYLSDKIIKYIVANNEKWTGNNDKSLINKDIASCINTGEGSRRCDASNYVSKEAPDNFDLKDTDRLIQDGTLQSGKWDKINESCRRVYDPNGIAPTIHTCQGGNTEPKICIKESTKKGYAEAHEGDGVYLDRPHQKRGVVQKGMIQTIKTSGNDVGVVVKDETLKRKMCNQLIEEGKVQENDVIRHSYSTSRMNGQMKDIQDNNMSPTLDTRCDCLGVVVAAAQRGRGEENKQQLEISDREVANVITTVQKDSMISNGLRIRKLTPKECWRLMGFEDKDIDKCIEGGMSNAQLYKQAGNSIVVGVLEYLLIPLYFMPF